MKLASIDIGSNAARLQVSRLLLPANGQKKFKRVEYLRFPLRLGDDVFKQQRVSAQSEKKLIQLLHALKLLIELYGVDAYMICATSALREANNKLEIVQRIKEVLGLSVDIVDGDQEAALIARAIQPLLGDHNYLHVDAGGGSTEVSFYIGSKQVASRSFKIGTVKLLENHDVETVWEEMQTWIHTQRQRYTRTPIGIATGGNIRKLAQLAGGGVRKPFSLKRLKAMQDYLSTYSLKERINKLELNPDRADVILPAAQIYATAMKWGGVKKILVPDISLRDGIIQVLYERLSQKSDRACVCTA